MATGELGLIKCSQVHGQQRVAVPHRAAVDLGKALPQAGGRQKVYVRFQGTLKMWKNQLRTITSTRLRKSLEQKILGVWEKVWVWYLMCTPCCDRPRQCVWTSFRERVWGHWTFALSQRSGACRAWFRGERGHSHHSHLPPPSPLSHTKWALGQDPLITQRLRLGTHSCGGALQPDLSDCLPGGGGRQR